MTAKYRVVHFVPDPYNGTRIPVAAIVAGAQGVSLASASLLPGAACLGRPALHATMRMVLESLYSINNLNALPVAVGPHAVLDVERDIPGEVTDPVAWVEAYVLPTTQHDRPVRQVRNAKRATEGFRFFEMWKVSKFVHPQFQPELLQIGGTPAPMARKLGPVSHWVGGPETGLMLMEPLIPSRHSYQEDVATVFRRFAGYRAFLNRGDVLPGTREGTKLCVYVLPGGDVASRGVALSAFEEVQAAIVDTNDDSAQRAFVEEVASLGIAAEPQTNVVEHRAN